MSRQATRLRQLFNRPGLTRLIGAHNALGAKLAERAGFDGVWASGLEISTTYAVPDANILTMSEFLAASEAMADATDLPVVSDCDTGYGNSNNAIHMVRKFEAAGVAAVCIEDKLFPKVNSFVPGRQELASIAEFVGKIMAAKNAQTSPDFMVIARVEALIAGWGQDEALKRAHAYANAGADAILIHSKSKSPQEIIDFVRAWDFSAPLVVVPTTYYTITAKEIESLGIKMVIYANHGLRASIQNVLEVYREILQAGSTAPVEERIAPMKLVFEIQGMPQFKRDEEAFVRTGAEHTRAIIPAAGDHLNEYSMKNIAADIPMAMIDINGKPLLQRQLEVLNVNGVRDVTVTGGYKREKIRPEGFKLTVNTDWETTGEMASILAGDSQPGFDGRTLVAYSDILFDGEAVGKLLKSQEDITLLVDRTFDSKNYASDRKIDLVELAGVPAESTHSRRSLSAGAGQLLARIGSKSVPPESAHAEFTGLAIFTRKGWAGLRESYEAAKAKSGGKPFHEASSFAKASLTDMIQEIADHGFPVHCLEVASGWTEIHSFDDYKLVCSLVAR